VINRRSVFARKNYFYPDLPKGYQISQYELPIVQGGSISIVTKTGEKSIRLTRAHLEEDAGKSLHEDFHGMTGIDLNRAGTPLLEIVSEPDMCSAEEAVAYAKALHALVRWIGICDGNMQEGSFRCDANVSVRRPGAPLGTRCEIKNLNSFRFLERAIEFEAQRQIGILEDGGKIVQETRLYDPDKDETRSMRTKEEAHDYRYFPDPDLPPLEVSEHWIEEIKSSMPELPEVKRQRFVQDLKLPVYTASLLTSSRDEAEFFEKTVTVIGARIRRTDNKYYEVVRNTANATVGEFSVKLGESGKEFASTPVRPEEWAALRLFVADGTISVKTAKEEVLEAMFDGKGTAGEIIAKHGLKQISDASAIEKIVDEVLARNAKQVEDYRAGKEKAFNSLVGQVMKATQGKANPAQVNAILKRKLAG
jgi:aspartyl-tRNA(Asn)/glutamyl-tRNA(Gln) amidotransferase subunit B